MSKDRKPKVFNYLQMTQRMPLCANRFECESNPERPLIDAYDVPDLRNGEIEVEDSKAKERINRLLGRYVICPTEPSQDASETDLLQYAKALADYKETCNSLKWLYNQFCGEVEDYKLKYTLIRGTGRKCGKYDNITDYYRDVRKCNNIILNREFPSIELSVREGLITSVKLVCRHSREIPTFGGEMAESESRVLTAWIDPDSRFNSTKRMTFTYCEGDEHLYSFVEIYNNVKAYLAEVVESELLGTPDKNATREQFYTRLNCIYRYVYDNEIVVFEGNRRKDSIIDFIVELLGFDEDAPFIDFSVLYRYLGNVDDKTLFYPNSEKLDRATLSFLENSVGNNAQT